MFLSRKMFIIFFFKYIDLAFIKIKPKKLPFSDRLTYVTQYTIKLLINSKNKFQKNGSTKQLLLFFFTF